MLVVLRVCIRKSTRPAPSTTPERLYFITFRHAHASAMRLGTDSSRLDSSYKQVPRAHRVPSRTRIQLPLSLLSARRLGHDHYSSCFCSPPHHHEQDSRCLTTPPALRPQFDPLHHVAACTALSTPAASHRHLAAASTAPSTRFGASRRRHCCAQHSHHCITSPLPLRPGHPLIFAAISAARRTRLGASGRGLRCAQDSRCFSSPPLYAAIS